MLAAAEDVQVVVPVDADGGDLLERPAVGQTCPVLGHAVAEVAFPKNDRHFFLRLRWFVWEPRRLRRWFPLWVDYPATRAFSASSAARPIMPSARSSCGG